MHYIQFYAKPIKDMKFPEKQYRTTKIMVRGLVKKMPPSCSFVINEQKRG
jgi:hypothetical protein